MTEQTDRTGRGQMVRTPAQGQEVEKAGQEKQRTLIDLLQSMKGEIARAVPAHLTGDRMARVALTALRTTRDLDKCTSASFAGCIMACAALGLECNTPMGEAYLIPRDMRRKQGNNWTTVKECTLIIGYQGMMSLGRRSGMIAGIQAIPVFSGDRFRYSFGLSPVLEHEPSDSPDRVDPKKLTHAYAIARLKEPGADPVFVVLTKREIEERRFRGASGLKDRNGNQVKTPWDDNYVKMALKTAIRELFTWIPRSAEMAQASTFEEISERKGGGALINELPDDTAKALLGSGIDAPPEVTDDGEVLDGELEPKGREPGSDDA